MKKVFISVGMHGRDAHEVEQDLVRAKLNIKKLYGDDVEFIDNWSTVGPDNCNRLWYLGEAIKKLGGCEICYFVKGWRKHKGCVAEYEICKIYQYIDIVEES